MTIAYNQQASTASPNNALVIGVGCMTNGTMKKLVPTDGFLDPSVRAPNQARRSSGTSIADEPICGILPDPALNFILAVARYRYAKVRQRRAQASSVAFDSKSKER
jgi:hypothetical protein